MGGDVTAESSPGKGSMFRLEIPAEEARPDTSLRRRSGPAVAARHGERATHDIDAFEAVSRLPPELVEQLRRASKIADYDELAELIERIPGDQTSLARELKELLDRYAYEDIARRLA
jgi:hypothetical protein